MEKNFFWKNKRIRKTALDVIQINLGNRCNQSCVHCHVEASPAGSRNMDRKTAEKIITKLSELEIKNIEFTGGAPELNPSLRLFVKRLSAVKNITVRTNLTALAMLGNRPYLRFYKEHRVNIIASLPCVYPDNVDAQRGAGIFSTSIAVLKRLNDLGYGAGSLTLDLVYNPLGACLPPARRQLQQLYTQELKERYDICFDNVIPLVNAPVGRFKEHLCREKRLAEYLTLLRLNYNPATLPKLMCKTLVSIDYRGYVYDCDFNLALDKKIRGFEGSAFWDIDFSFFHPDITFAEHCYSCTAGQGSSCHGVLIREDCCVEKNSKSVCL